MRLLALLLCLLGAGLRAEREPEGMLEVSGAEGSLRLFRFETEPWPLEPGRNLPDNSRIELDAGAVLRLRYGHFLDFSLAGPARLTVYVVPAPPAGELDQDRVVLKMDEGTLLVDGRFQFGRPADVVLGLPDQSLPLPLDQRFFTQVASGRSSFFVPLTWSAAAAWPANYERQSGRMLAQVPPKPLRYQAPLPARLYEELTRPVRLFIIGRDFNQDTGIWPRPAVLGPLLAERLSQLQGLQVVEGSGDTFYAYQANNALKTGQDFFIKELARARGAQWVLAGNCVAETLRAGQDPDGRGRRVQGLAELRLLETQGEDGGLELVSESANTLVARAGRPLEQAAREAMEAASAEAADYLAYHFQNLLAGKAHAEKLINLQFEGADKAAWAQLKGALASMDSVQRVFRRSFAGGLLKVDVMLRKDEAEFRRQWQAMPWKGARPHFVDKDELGHERYVFKK